MCIRDRLNTNPMPLAALGHPNDPIRICDSSGIPPEAQADTIVCRWNDVEMCIRDRIMAWLTVAAENLHAPAAYIAANSLRGGT